MENHLLEGCEYRKILCKDCKKEYIFKEGHSKENCLSIQLKWKNEENEKKEEIIRSYIRIIEQKY